MKQPRKLWIMALAAVLVVSCTCSLFPFGVDLPQSKRVGNYMTVNYPEDWYATTDYDLAVFSPNYMDIDADDEDIDQPFMLVVPFEAYFGDDWFGELDNPDEILDDMAYEFDVSYRSTTTVEVGDVRWTRGSFRGPFGDLPGTWEGWVAVELLPRGGAVIIAVAPESEWGDVDNIFDAMMEGIEFAD